MPALKSCSFTILLSCISLNRKHTPGGKTSVVTESKAMYSFPYVLYFSGREPSVRGRASSWYLGSHQQCRPAWRQAADPKDISRDPCSPLVVYTLCQVDHVGQSSGTHQAGFERALKTLRNRHMWKVIAVLLRTEFYRTEAEAPLTSSCTNWLLILLGKCGHMTTRPIELGMESQFSLFLFTSQTNISQASTFVPDTKTLVFKEPGVREGDVL